MRFVIVGGIVIYRNKGKKSKGEMAFPMSSIDLFRMGIKTLWRKKTKDLPYSPRK